jgi:uncharacterized membrane protein
MNTNTTAQFTAFAKKIGWGLMLLLAILLFVLASRYLTHGPKVYFSEQRDVYIVNIVPLLTHIAGSMLATILGPFQFLRKIRTGRYLKIHRWLGRVYLLGVLFGGVGGAYMGTIAYGGPIARLGLMTIATLWLVSGYMAYINIRNNKIELHRKWMVINYAITFAGVTLRLWQIVFGVIGLDFLTGYIIVTWLSWVPNLLVALWINNRNHSVEKTLSSNYFYKEISNESNCLYPIWRTRTFEAGGGRQTPTKRLPGSGQGVRRLGQLSRLPPVERTDSASDGFWSTQTK